jgi:hypothetical protein
LRFVRTERRLAEHVGRERRFREDDQVGFARRKTGRVEGAFEPHTKVAAIVRGELQRRNRNGPSHFASFAAAKERPSRNRSGRASRRPRENNACETYAINVLIINVVMYACPGELDPRGRYSAVCYACRRCDAEAVGDAQ